MRNRLIKSIMALFFISTLSISAIAAKNKTGGVNPYFTSEQITLSDGTKLDNDIISGPPKAPGSTADSIVQPVSEGITGVQLTVPAYSWYMGCSATSGSMIAAYWDRNGYSNIYAGPANGGLMPMDNSSWPAFTDVHGDAYRTCPLTGSRNGVDGRTTRGTSDDYWYYYNSGVQDPYITGAWTQHTWGDAIGDYMKTSQSAYGNNDGDTHFWTYTSSSTPLACDSMPGLDISNDGTYGRRQFYQARGYTVTDCYNQKVDGVISGGFSLAQYQAEIDAGRPVMINLDGHTVVGMGYQPSTTTIYIHDTWDYFTHSMTWNGCYGSLPCMQMLSVSIVNLAALPLPGAFAKATPLAAANATTEPTLTWSASSSAADYIYCIDTINNNSCDTGWTSAGPSTSVSLSGLTDDTNYYWEVVARNPTGLTYADGGTWWGFKARKVTFADVPASYWDWAYIETIFADGITSGCSQIPLMYCPGNPVTREQMAVFILKSEHGSSYVPPAMTGVFTDVPIGYWAGTWIEQLYHEGITAGCSQIPLMYCPAATVTREQMAVFLMKAEHGTSYTPPAMTGVFTDVLIGYWAGTWIEQVYHEGITSGCSQVPLMYCPANPVTRDQMAVFLVKTFHLLWP